MTESIHVQIGACALETNESKLRFTPAVPCTNASTESFNGIDPKRRSRGYSGVNDRPLLAELSRWRLTQNDPKHPFRVAAIALDLLTYNESRGPVIS
jgi:hypothetical protein